MRQLLIVLLLVQGSVIAVAQGQATRAAERDAVLKTVQAFFDTMAAKDVEGARRILMLRGASRPARAGRQTGEPPFHH